MEITHSRIRPSKLSTSDLSKLLQIIRIINHKRKSIMRHHDNKPSVDYVFEHVINRCGYYVMTTESLNNWLKDHPRMIEKLKLKDIECLQVGLTKVKFKSNAYEYLQSN